MTYTVYPKKTAITQDNLKIRNLYSFKGYFTVFITTGRSWDYGI